MQNNYPMTNASADTFGPNADYFGVLTFSTGRVHAEEIDGGLVCGGKGGEGLRFALFGAEEMSLHLDRVPVSCKRCAAVLASRMNECSACGMPDPEWAMKGQAACACCPRS